MKKDVRPQQRVAETDDDRALDARLRAVLDPEPGQARRLVARALAAEQPARARRSPLEPRLSWALATAAVALVAVLALPRGTDSPSLPSSVGDATVRDVTTSDIATGGSPQGFSTPVLTISNASGVLEITSAAGPKAILFPGDTP